MIRFLLILILIPPLACSSDDPEASASNTFQMELNSVPWQPYSDKSGCYQQWNLYTFQISDSRGTFTIYTLHAFMDPNPERFRYDFQSIFASAEEFKFQVIQSADETDFLLHKDTTLLDNFARYTRNLDDESIIYESDSTRHPFTVSIERYIPNQPFPGVEVTFNGVIYNITQPSDSLIITNGRFLQENLVVQFYHCY
jgi:hypothetical protein